MSYKMDNKHKDDNTNPSRKSNPATSTGFKLGSFTRSLMARAQDENSGLSPATLQSLLNPMRSQLGLPRLSFVETDSLQTTPPELPQTIATPPDPPQPPIVITTPPQEKQNKIAATIKKKKPQLKEKEKWKFQSETVQNKEYLVIKQLGKGGCGEVLLVLEKSSRQLFALKRVNLNGLADNSIDECLNEVEMLVELRDSDYVVHIYAWEYDKGERLMKILMEVGQCDLGVSLRGGMMTGLKLRSVWERLLTILAFIHQRGIVHADLKPGNFIWSGDNLKIIDFGIASKLQNDHTSINICPKGTLNFISPETIQPVEGCGQMGVGKISPKSDIWSLGIILYLLVYKKTPFDHINHPVQKMNAIIRGVVEYPPIPECFKNIGDFILKDLKSCFVIDYRNRLSAEEILRGSGLIN